MVSNISAQIVTDTPNYPITDSSLPFSEYIAQSRLVIEEKREDLKLPNANVSVIMNANSPYELYPAADKKVRAGALLIHGLLDCPFSLRDIGLRLQSNGILSRAILLPGHGTVPADLISVSYQDWIQATRYGVESLSKEVDQIFLIGYSTGAALSVYQALGDKRIAGIILLAPAIKIKAPVDIVVGWHNFIKWLTHNGQRQWIYKEEEIDYAKYLSIPFNPVTQVSKLTKVISDLYQQSPLPCPVFMALAREDETISSKIALHFFGRMLHEKSRVLLYTGKDVTYEDKRILVRKTNFDDLNIRHFSHVATPFAPNNPHYGQHGDYVYATRNDIKECYYGAYNRIEENASEILYKLGVMKLKRRTLTYNPDFDFMAEKIINFILENIR